MADWLQRLNRTVDRLFGFELQPEELQALERAKVPELDPPPAIPAHPLGDQLAGNTARLR